MQKWFMLLSVWFSFALHAQESQTIGLLKVVDASGCVNGELKVTRAYCCEKKDFDSKPEFYTFDDTAFLLYVPDLKKSFCEKSVVNGSILQGTIVLSESKYMGLVTQYSAFTILGVMPPLENREK